MEVRVDNVKRACGKVLNVTVSAVFEGIRRYRVSFRKNPVRNGNRLQAYNRELFGETGLLESANVHIPSKIFGKLAARVAAILFEAREL